MTANLHIQRTPGFVWQSVRQKRHGAGELHCDRAALSALAERFGTPLYCYSARAIRERYRAFDAAFRGVPHTVCYSVKANSNLTLLRMLAKFGAGFDVVSGGELERVLRAARPAAKRVVFSGVGKTEAEMDAALRAQILLFNVESEGELALLSARATRARRRAAVALRVNPDVPAETHPYIATGLREHKFGVAIAEAERLYDEAARLPGLRVSGVSVHIGSQITNFEPFAAAMQRVAELVARLRRAGHEIRYVDCGGGMGIPYASPTASEDDFAARARDYARAITGPLRGLGVHLLLEPGRSIVAPAGALLTRVLYVKRNGEKWFAIVDAAMNDLIRPALYKAQHEMVVVRNRTSPLKPKKGLNGSPTGPTQTYDVVGPICETGDFFARERELPELQPGDLIAVLDAGAYGMSLASNYNTRGRAAEVLVDGARTKIVRRRETAADVMRAEV